MEEVADATVAEAEVPAPEEVLEETPDTIAMQPSSEAVAQVGETEYETLQDAFDAAQNGDTVTLLCNVDTTGEANAYDTRNLWISKSITVDGDGHTLTTKDRGIGVQGASDKINVTFKDITIANTSDGARCIDTRGNIGTLTLQSVTLTTTAPAAPRSPSPSAAARTTPPP